MKKYEKELLQILNGIEDSGSFLSTGVEKMTISGLQILYQRDLKNWKEDMDLLAKVEATFD